MNNCLMTNENFFLNFCEKYKKKFTDKISTDNIRLI